MTQESTSGSKNHRFAKRLGFTGSTNRQDRPLLCANVKLSVGNPAGKGYPIWITFPGLKESIDAEIWLEWGRRVSAGERFATLKSDRQYYRSIRLDDSEVEFDLCIRPVHSENWLWRKRLPVLHPSILDLQLRPLLIGNTNSSPNGTAFGGYTNVVFNESRSDNTQTLEFLFDVLPLKQRIGLAWKPFCKRRNRPVAELQLVHQQERWSLYGGDRITLGRNAPMPDRNDANDFVFRKTTDGNQNNYFGRLHAQFLLKNDMFRYSHLSSNEAFSDRKTAIQIRHSDSDVRTESVRDQVELDTRRTNLLQPGEQDFKLGRPHLAARAWYSDPIPVLYSHNLGDSRDESEFAETGSLGGCLIEMINPIPGVHLRHALIKSSLIIGSNPELCQIAFPKAGPNGVKERHIRIMYIDGGLWVEPYDRTCTLQIDGNPLYPNQLAPLTNQTTLRLGKSFTLSCTSIYQYHLP